MTTTRIPLVAQINVTIVSQAVTAAYGSAGDLVNYSAACSSVLLRNPGEVWPIEFKVGSGAWTRLEIYNTTLLSISLDTTTIRVRKALTNSGPGLVQIDIRGLASTYLAGDDAVDLGGEGGALTDLTDVDIADMTLFPGSLTVINETGELRAAPTLQVFDDDSFTLTSGANAGATIEASGSGALTLIANGTTGINLTANGDGGIEAQANGNGGIGLRVNNPTDYSEVYLQAQGASGIALWSNGTGGLNLIVNGGGAFTMNEAVAVAAQTIVIPGVGTQVFTHGILTSFTPV